MVAKITTPASIKKALNYNEQKVKEDMAECIYAHNFLKDAGELNFYEKISRFENLIALNKRAAINVVHISLNFGINENIQGNKLIEIATVYMQKIGFDDQPYLVYQHLDAGHPHVHIVSTNIQKDGKRISLHNLGKNQSNQARKEIEIDYHLVKAEEQKKDQTEKINPVNVQKIAYGKSPTKRAIANVLDAVLSKYKYASIAELNALLKLYNVVADNGEKGSKIFQHHGLVYRVLDENANKVGVPIKASSIYNKPTLSYLEQKFKENETLKESYKKQIKSLIDWVLFKRHPGLQSFQRALEKERITLVIRQNEQGIIYGLTYIDHNTKCIFNGSDLGKQYSAQAVLQKCGAPQFIVFKKTVEHSYINKSQQIVKNLSREKKPDLDVTKSLDVLMSPTEQYGLTPYQFRKRKKKKRKPTNQ